jgi:hypothetical protein
MTMALLAAACQRSAPAAARDLKLLGAALNDPARYPEAVNELARRPEAAQAAVREQSAPEGTRKAFLLRQIKDHLDHRDDYERWAQSKPEKPGDESSYFWSEQLLFGDPVRSETAAKHLSTRCCKAAGEASIWRIRDTSRDVDAGFEIAAATVAKAGESDQLVAALEAWYDMDSAVRTNSSALDALRSASNLLPAERHSAIEKKLLASLEQNSLTRAGRQARLALLWVVVDSASLERVAALRKSAWGTDLRRDIDPVLARAFVQAHRIGAAK